MTSHVRLWRRVIASTIVLLLLFDGGAALQLDNGVAGVPQIRCAENSITFSVRSQNLFRGNIYIKSQYGVPQCRQTYTTNDFNGASFTVRIGDCGMRRIRQLQPVGMNYNVVFVVNFHQQFVTKVDRAYNVRCFYAQSDKTVTSALEVSMLATQSLEQATMLMPNCEYSVRSGSLNGPRVRYARVGDRLVHRWECDNPNFGMLVKNCFVNDGSGSSIRVLDARGCPVFTPVIQGPLQYDNSLNLAYVEIWAYKFPDRAQLFFQCQIQVCNKRDNECVGVTPPNCPRVTQSQFQPGTAIDGSTDPNRVIGTFPAPTQPTLGLAVDNRPFVNPNPNPIRPVTIGRGPDGGYGIGAQQVDQNINRRPFPAVPVPRPAQGYGYPGQLPGYNTNTGQPFGQQQLEGGTQFVNTNNLLPARPYQFRARDDSTLQPLKKTKQTHKREIPINIMRFVESKNRSARDLLLAAEVEDDNTFDVETEPVYVQDAQDDDDDDDEHSPSPWSARNSQSCMNQTHVTAMLTIMSLLGTMLIASLGYIYILFRRQRQKHIASEGPPSLPSTSPSSISSSPPFSLLTRMVGEKPGRNRGPP